MKSALYYGDNLDVLRRYFNDETVDLVYLDPPFNSNKDYNVLFREHDGTKAAAQILAFGDTWEWNLEAERCYEEVVESGGRTADTMLALRALLGGSDMMAYLAMMAPRLIELRRVLRKTGSIYLHCDPTASHYLKLLMDGVFSATSYRNEITWKRTAAHNDPNQYGRNTDTILFYTKSDEWTWNPIRIPYNDEYRSRFKHKERDGRVFNDENLTQAGQGPARDFGERGKLDPPQGRHWLFDQDGIDDLIRDNLIYWTRNGRPRLKVYLDEQLGAPVQALWTDINVINSQAEERLQFPTQKPQALLERIINASSNEGDVVLDPFCGCGTAVEASQKLKRTWVGIDITHLSVSLIKHRLQNAFGDSIRQTYDVIGEPVSIPDAKALAAEDPYQFQFWALGLVGARPTEEKKGRDRGIDGRIFFHDNKLGQTKQIILSVKAGQNLAPAFVRDLRGVMERDKAEMGVLITMASPTREMRREAASAGIYTSAWGKHPRLQIVTVEELLSGHQINRPPTREIDTTLKKRVRSVDEPAEQLRLPQLS
jgi:DNA modification methylase